MIALAQNYIIRQDSLRASEAATKLHLKSAIKDSLDANIRGWQNAADVSNRIKDSLTANARNWQTQTQVESKISDSLIANSRSWQSAGEVAQRIRDSLNTNSRNWQNDIQVSSRISDSLSANVRGWQTAQQVRSVIGDSLNTNSRGWRTQAQAKQDAVDTTTYFLQGLSQQISELNNSINASLNLINQRLDTVEAKLNIPTIPNIYPPTNLTATGGLKQITLSWTQPASNYDSLQIYWSYSLSQTFLYLVKLDSPATTYQHTNLLNNTTYYYYIVSYNNGSYSSPSIIVNAKTDTVIREQFTILADFEDNNLSQLSSTLVDTVTSIVAARDSAKLHGNYGLLIQDNGYTADNVYARINYTAKDSVYLRFYIKIPSSFKSINTPNSFSVGGIFSGNTMLAGIYLARTTDVFTHKMQVYNGVTYVDVLGTVAKNQSYCLELYYKKGTGANAIVRLYIDGELIYTYNSSDEIASSNNIRVGIYSFGSRVEPNSYLFIDDIVVNNSFIGLYGGSSTGGGSSPTSNYRKYIAPIALGDGTGVDSSNAFGISSLNSLSLSPGDTVIFTSGYYDIQSSIVLNYSGTSTQYITFMSTYPYGAILRSSGASTIFTINNQYIRFKFLKFQNVGRSIHISSGGNVVFIDSCYASKFSSQGGFVFAGGTSGSYNTIDSIFIRYNTAINDTQTYTQADIVYCQYAQNIFIIKNYFVQKDTVDVTQHIDNIQTANNMGTVVIVGNKLENYKKESSQGMMLNIPQNGEQILYNNSVYVPANAKGISSYWIDNTSTAKVYYLNNTTYNRSATSGWVGVTAEYYGKNGVVSFNNLSFNDGTPNTSNIFSAVYYNYPVFWGDSINNNLYWTNYCPSPVGSPGAGNYYSITVNNVNTGATNIWSLATWQASTNNPDRNSLQTNPSFKDKTTGDLRLAVGSPAVGTGKDISSLINYFNAKYPGCGFEWKDINGTLRGSAPNIGAYEGAY